MKNQEFEIVITGAGLTGLFLANFLAQQEFSVALIEQHDLKQTNDDDIRTTALNLAACKILENSGLWKELREYASPINDIIVLNNNSDAELYFDHSAVSNEPMGHIIKNSDFKKIMLHKAKAHKNITIFDDYKISNISFSGSSVKITNGSTNIIGQLALAAQGKFSKMLADYKIDVLRHEYKQTSLTFLIRHEKPHLNLAVEHFLPQGPIATLPMQDQFTSSVVWSVKSPKDKEILSLDNQEKEKIFNQYLPDSLGEGKIISKIQSFPLSGSFALKFYRDRLLFIGDAIHSMHPLAGQGFNLTIMDIEKLVSKLKFRKALGLDIGSPDLTKEFAQDIFKDDAIMVASVSLINSLFTNDNKVLDKIRNLGLKTIDNLAPIKRSMIAYAMGLK